ncbi:MAG: FAD:protein FMN transferase [Parahaliea sp.]
MAVLVLPLLLGACDQSDPQSVTVSGGTMGTTWTVSYIPAQQTPDKDSVQSTIEIALNTVDATMSTYREDSEISRFNRAPLGQWQTVSPAFIDILTTALAIGKLSDGAYDVSVGPLVDLWGFGPDGPVKGVPQKTLIDERLQRVGQQYLEIDRDNSQVRKLRSLALDFSSIAKGYGVDRVADALAASDIVNYLVEVGGEMRLAGNSPRGDAWRIAIEQPQAEGTRAIARVLSISDVAVATSGDYRNFFEMDGKRYSHSIDPRTGYPVAHDLVSVTVVADNAMLADAWATALEVLGHEKAMAIANAEGLAVYLIQSKGDNFIATHSSAFEPFLAQSPSVQMQQ